jgi:L-threonylcarbamoyladenylate synthase
MLKSHYAPHTPLVIHKTEEMITLPDESGAAFLFFDRPSMDAWLSAAKARAENSPASPPGSSAPLSIRFLSASGDTVEAASCFFEALHELDHLGLRRIHAQLAPDSGLGPAINDRLSRAAAK